MTYLPDGDLRALQGFWEQVALEINGVNLPQDDLSPDGGITCFNGNRFTVHAADNTLLLEGTFELDESATPKQIDYIDSIGPDAGKELPAIYKLEGDVFTFVAAGEGSSRPTIFRTGPGEVMRTFARRTVQQFPRLFT
jgi:uncharacterized protein (TIGR03067 family)